MRKMTLIVAAALMTTLAHAQKSAIKAARNALADKDYTTAQKTIDAAVANPETQDDPAAWNTRGLVYLAMQQAPGNEGKKYYEEAAASLKKVIALKPTYEKEDVNKKLLSVTLYNFNDGNAAYNKQDYANAYKHFGEVVNIFNLEDGKRFGSNKIFDTLARQSATYQGYAAYYNNQPDLALPLLLKAKTDPIVKDPRNYLMVADIYELKNDDANLLATINEAKAAYPKEQSIINRELNYYVRTNKIETLMNKLEDAIKADPSNPDLLFNLAVTYDNMANPKDKDGKDLPKPANYKETFAKAEAAYENTTKAAPNKAEVYYNYGALYFNRAVGINEEMNKLGSSNAEIKKYDVLKAERDEWFNKALPQFEKAIAIWEPIGKKLAAEDFNSYQATLVAAKEIYAKQNNFQKATDLKKKLEALK